MLGQAQTGTGKTAAFALAGADAIDLSSEPQVLVLVRRANSLCRSPKRS
jgi:superfamily II DNA/RNA helicase